MTAAINAVLEMPIIAVDGTTKVDVTSKWKGTSANDIVLEIVGSTTAGTTFAFTQPAGGLVNPDVDTALNQVGDIWETMMLNCMDVADTATLDKYDTFGEGRWGALVRKPLVVFSGETSAGVTAATAVPDARKTDRTNAQLVAPGSNDLPFVVAARQLARIAPVANNNPPHDYGSQDATGLTPGTDGEQWTYAERDVAVKAGSSTVEIKDGVVNVSDVVTFFHPTGDPTPAYRFVVDIVKLQNIIFNLDLEFATAKWDGAPLIPDNQPTVNPDAKKPRTAVTAANSIIDSLALNAIISDPETAKKNTVAEIDSGNPKRLNLAVTLQLSGNTNIKSIDLNFGFFFGTAAVVA
jgi:phage tail sheath gpL-like